MTTKEKKKSNPYVKKIISSPYFEVRPKAGGSRMIIVGAIGVSEVDSCGVTVKCHGMKLRISGAKILINILEHNTLEITGAVEDIKIINA